MEMIQFTIGPLNGDSIDLQIPREGTVRDILMKYVGAYDLSEVEARKCRFIFNTTFLRRRKYRSFILPTLQEKEDHLYPPSIQYVVVLKRNALNRTGGNTPPYNRASGIYWRQRIPY